MAGHKPRKGGPPKRKKHKIARNKQWRPKCGKTKVMENDMKFARQLDENDVQSIINCCQICHPNNKEYANIITSSVIKPNAYDIGKFFVHS